MRVSRPIRCPRCGEWVELTPIAFRGGYRLQDLELRDAVTQFARRTIGTHSCSHAASREKRQPKPYHPRSLADPAFAELAAPLLRRYLEAG